jgi:predicted membrane protein
MILDLVKNPLKSEVWLLVIATIPAVIAALVFDVDDKTFSTQFLGFAFLITTLILWLADLVSGVAFETKQVKWWNALAMGIMQAVAILRAFRRSGATISAACSRLSRSARRTLRFDVHTGHTGPRIGRGVRTSAPRSSTARRSVQWAGRAPVWRAVSPRGVGFPLAIKFICPRARRVRLTVWGGYTRLASQSAGPVLYSTASSRAGAVGDMRRRSY